MKRVLSCLLLGGLGNQLFQISTVLSYSKEKNVNYILGIIPAQCNKYPFTENDIIEWGGHPVSHPIKEITNLGDVFPKLKWITNIKKYKNLFIDDLWIFNVNIGGRYIPLENNVKLPSRILGYFFSHKYWHNQREFLLETFEPNQKIKDYIQNKYSKLFEKNTVSVHLRLGHQNDPAGEVNHVSMNQNYPDYYKKSLALFEDKYNILIFTDNTTKAENYKKFFMKEFPNNDYFIIDENVYISLIMMSMCNHHILHNSTLSFWGAYLNKKQPNCKTILNKNFFRNHPEELIPENYNWTIL